MHMVNKSADKKRLAVEILPGVEVSKALIDAATETTHDITKISLIDEARERAKAQKLAGDSELRNDIDVSKQITQALLDQVGKPEPRRVNVDDLPPFLKRAVVAYMTMREAQDEYADAVNELAKNGADDSTSPEKVVTNKAINVDPTKLVVTMSNWQVPIVELATTDDPRL